MASLIVLKRRIGSIRNTRQITKAMELVSSSKLRRAQQAAQAGRAYREAAYDVLARLGSDAEVKQQPLFKSRPVKSKLYIVITSNSGLVGAYNSNIERLLANAAKVDQENGVKVSVITIGNKGMQFVRRTQGLELYEHYPAFGDEPTEADILPVLRSAVDSFKNGNADEVRVLFTDFRSSIAQIARNLPLLPAKAEIDEDAKPKNGVISCEPDVETVVEQVGVRLTQAQIWQALLESQASEHAMRAVAMKNATDNANDLIDDYTLEYNTARQGAITQEIAEISGGAEALNG